VLPRSPDAEEAAMARTYIAAAGLDDPVRRQWVNLVQGLLLSNEFVFVE
jgi:hypothetical protein